MSEKEKELKFNKGAIIDKPGSTRDYKTGAWRTYKPKIDQEKCIKCGKCWMCCPDGAVKHNKDGTFEIDYEYCKGCLICQEECPVKAITSKVEEK